jgi:hypothetical protein
MKHRESQSNRIKITTAKFVYTTLCNSFFHLGVLCVKKYFKRCVHRQALWEARVVLLPYYLFAGLYPRSLAIFSKRS